MGLKRSAQWVLGGDIKACFDKIGHQWLIDNIQTDKRMLKQWLECGFIDKGLFYKTAEGTPQGGIISPTLMLLTLAGLENLVKSVARKTGDRVNFIGYEWQFHGWQKIANMDCHFNLVQIAKTPIKRHVKIMSKATPYDPFYEPFPKERKANKQGRNLWFEPALAALKLLGNVIRLSGGLSRMQ